MASTVGRSGRGACPGMLVLLALAGGCTALPDPAAGVPATHRAASPGRSVAEVTGTHAAPRAGPVEGPGLTATGFAADREDDPRPRDAGPAADPPANPAVLPRPTPSDGPAPAAAGLTL